MAVTTQNYLAEKVVWQTTDDPFYPYATEIDGARVCVRVNDFPEQPLYTLIVNDVEVTNFDDWPSHWERDEE